jgi:peptide/nickel transport system substrate-binding protein
MMSMRRREFLGGLTLGGSALAAGPSILLSACSGSGNPSPGGKDATLRVVNAQSLSSLDPIWTTAPGTREYGFLTFDQLVAVDANYVPKPQMAEGWTVSDDGRAYAFTLREGLKFHDNAPVRAVDCIASIQRWGKRDSFGQLLMPYVDSMAAADDRRFTIRLTQPFPLLPAALGKSSSAACLIMPERMAETDPGTQVTAAIGSGPFRFVREEWVPGSKAVWERFEGYVPRSEPPSGLAGGRVPAVKRIEWSQITDASTALSALQAGEQDYWLVPPADLLPLLSGNADITVGQRLSTDTCFMLQPNHQQPPFDNPAARHALAAAIDQMAIMRSIAGERPQDAHAARSFYDRTSPLYTEAGSEVLAKPSIDRAKQMLAASGYKGEKVVLLSGAEAPASNLGQIIEDLLRRIGMNVTLTTLDFASMIQRRTNRGPIDKGGWSLFVTGWTGSDLIDPAVHPMLRGAGFEGYPGWCDAPEIERLRKAWVLAPEAEQKAIAEQIQVEAFRVLPYIPLGGTVPSSAWRKQVTGVFKAPYGVYWTVGKSA